MKISISDLVSNLRSIHQTLFLATVTLLLAILLASPPSSTAVALKELNAIQNLTSEQNWNPNYLVDFFQRNDYLGSLMGDNIFHFQSWVIEFQESELSVTDEPLNQFHHIIISAPMNVFIGWEYSLIPPFPSEDAAPIVSAPRTIKEFSDIWNKSRSVKMVTVHELADYAYVQRTYKLPIEKVNISILSSEQTYDSESGGPYGVFRSNIFPPETIDSSDLDKIGLTYPPEHDRFYFYNHQWKIWVPAYTADETILDATEYLCKELKIEQSKCLGPFEQVFPNIYFASKEYDELPFQNVVEALQRQRESELQNFDIAGIRVPVTLVSFVGSLVLIFLQIYLALHLHATLSVHMDADLPVWIGLLHDWFSRVIFLISTAFFPMLTIYLLNLRLPSDDSSYSHFGDLMLYGSIAASIFIITDFILLWRQIATQTVQTGKSHKPLIRKQNRNF